jgi:hypothetical protein
MVDSDRKKISNRSSNQIGLLVGTIITVLATLFGVFIGAYLSDQSANSLWQKQQTTNLKNIAKAIDIDLDSINQSNSNVSFAYKTDLFPGRFYFIKQSYFVNNNIIYNSFTHDISQFDRNLSADIYGFYSNLSIAESDREFMVENYLSTDPQIHNEAVFRYSEMIVKLETCINQIPSIREKLKDIYEK